MIILRLKTKDTSDDARYAYYPKTGGICGVKLKGRLGYFITIISLAVSVGILFLVTQGENPPEDTLAFFIALVFFSGFLGGFFAPYHIVKNSFYSALTIVIVMGIPIGFFFFALGNVGQTEDPLEGLGLLLVLIIILAILVAGLIGSIIAVLIGGLIGSIFGRLVFSREKYSD